ncbi:hypothetical protein WJX73_005098 [Symbiochloris irregularis]|uniref:RRM domain-containing protein n=1 Tax=Symbiochloris irregularis TaxID=706552 RepID=A0AAW1P341_9CHLO
MNPLTQIKNTQKVTRQEIAAGVSDSASWHAKFKHSAYVFAGGLTYGLTEGDLLAVFSQYGEIVDVNLVKDKDTGKSRGFAFLAYEDQRSTVLAVDNLSGAKVAGRTIKVDHVDNYKRKRAEVEGREESSSEEEESDGEPDEAAQAAVLASAAADGAAVVSEAAATTRARPDAGANGGEGGDAPWAASGSIFSLLSGPAPTRPSNPEAALLPSAEGHTVRKEKKAKDKKKDKAHKEHKHKKHKADMPGPHGLRQPQASQCRHDHLLGLTCLPGYDHRW